MDIDALDISSFQCEKFILLFRFEFTSSKLARPLHEVGGGVEEKHRFVEVTFRRVCHIII